MADIHTIIKWPPYTIPKAFTMLETRFPKWCLRGVRFDLDLVPIDKDSMLKNLDVVKQDIERMHNWQKLVDELQRMNRYNQEAMLTMEYDKSEWEKVLKECDDKISSIAAHNKELEANIKALQDELGTSSTLHNQREELLKRQVREAHAAQSAAESKLFAEQNVTENYQNDVTQLREKATSQSLEISILQAKLATAEQERDQAIAEKSVAEQTHEDTKAEVNSTLFDFYVHSVMGVALWPRCVRESSR